MYLLGGTGGLGALESTLAISDTVAHFPGATVSKNSAMVIGGGGAGFSTDFYFTVSYCHFMLYQITNLPAATPSLFTWFFSSSSSTHFAGTASIIPDAENVPWL